MVNRTIKSLEKNKTKKGLTCIDTICWIIIPVCAVILLVLDGTKIYSFNTERLLVIGVCVLIILIPFFSEITIKNISIKKENNSK